MPTTRPLHIKRLKLDLSNFRTVPQKNEEDAIHAMISSDPDWFWALMESILKDGYLPTENIIVLKKKKSGNEFIVKEGNRRIGALKCIFHLITLRKPFPPNHIKDQIKNISNDWKKNNLEVPCAIYEPEEAAHVDKIVSLIHGKGEKAGRRGWNALARARHNRDKNSASEPALDLLEKFLEKGKNLTSPQRERWGGDYPVTVLDEAIKRFAPNLGFTSSRELSEQYPRKIKERDAVENILLAIGTLEIKFPVLRKNSDNYFHEKYGIPSNKNGDEPPSGKPSTGKSQDHDPSSNKPEQEKSTTKDRKTKALPLNDPKNVIRALRSFSPKGNNREKIVTLKNEAQKLDLSYHPHAFCFLLRSMFEISAKVFCKDHARTSGLKYTKPDGTDKTLEKVLRDITSHLTKNNTDKQMQRKLHGAMAELGTKNGFLSVTSMNQLIHNQNFSINEIHIATLFANIFPLLEEMNN